MLDKVIKAAGAELPGHESICSIKEIGTWSAAILLSGSGNIDDFESADKLAAYVSVRLCCSDQWRGKGSLLKVSQSNDTDRRGRITKRGKKLMRTTLVQCTPVAKVLRIYELLLSAHQGARWRRKSYHRNRAQAAADHL